MSTPGNDRHSDQKNKQQPPNSASATPDQGRSAFSAGTTGEGASQLGGESYQQGSVAGKDVNYKNEPGKPDTEQPLGGTQKGGGATGYDADREQEQVNKEREDMNNERDQDQIDVERPQVSPDEQKGAGQQPGNPELH